MTKKTMSAAQALKDHYQRFSLSPAQAQALSRLQNGGASPGPWRSRRSLIAAAAAGLILAVGASVWLGRSQLSQIDAIAAEMSHNHNKRFEPEVTSDSYEEIRRQMTKLDFSVAQSSRLPPGSWSIAGARYCAVSGVTAARIGLVNLESSTAFTLYQAPIPPGLDLQGTVERLLDGNKITLWTEDGLLFGLVGPP